MTRVVFAGSPGLQRILCKRSGDRRGVPVRSSRCVSRMCRDSVQNRSTMLQGTDGNPANLNPLQSEPEAAKFVEYMGGADAVIAKATVDFDAGEYRFVATALNKVVTADPDNWPARHLLADTLEQL